MVFLTACSFLSVKSIKKYISYNKNYEYIFYWGLSFILLAFGFAINTSIILSKQELLKLILANIGKISETLGWMLQLYAVSYSVGWCIKYNTEECDSCQFKYCKRKIKRIAVTLFFILIIIGSVILLTAGLYDNHCVNLFLANFQSTGIQALDIYYTIIHAGIVVWISVKLSIYYAAKIYLFYAYVVLFLSKIIRVISILTYNFSNNALEQIEEALIFAAFIVLIIEIKKILDD